MGNNCVGGDADYKVGGRKKASQEPEITNLHDARMRSGSGSVVAPGGKNGNFRKTGAAAKYMTAQSPPDVNRNNTPNEPELNFTLQSPVLEEKEVVNFFDNSQSGNEMISALRDARESHPQDESPTRSGGSSGPTTHVQVFSLPSQSGTVPAEEPDNPVNTMAPMINTANTHVEVFSLSVLDDPRSDKQHKSDLPQTVHIDLTAFLDATGSPKKTDTKAGFDNLAYIENEPPSSALVSNEPSSTYVVNEPSFTHISMEPSSPVHVHIPEKPSSSPAHTIHTSPAHQETKSYTPTDEEDTVLLMIPSHHNVPKYDAHSVSSNDSDSSVHHELDGNCFFFGMESLKFSSQRFLKDTPHVGDEADREIAEIMADIDTIEDGVWLRLRAPDDSDVHTDNDDVTTHTDNVTGHHSLYSDVLGQLRDVCVKVEDLLRKKGVNNTDELDDDWFKMPEFGVLDRKYEKKTNDAQTSTINRLVKVAKSDDEQKVKDILANYKRTQEKILRMRDAERQKLMDRLREKMAKHNLKRPASITDDNDDEAAMQARYGDLMKMNDSISDEEVVLDVDQSSEDDYSSDESPLSYSDSDESVEVDPEAKVMLKATLSNDIRSRMADMTSNDFLNVMDMYRKERRSIRNIRDTERNRLNQSLWEKMSERRKHVDQSVHEGMNEESDSDSIHIEDEGAAVIDGSCLSTVTDTASRVHQSPTSLHTDVSTQIDALCQADIGVGIREEELENMHKELLSKTFKGKLDKTLDEEDLNRLMKEHLSNVNKLRDNREKEADNHKQKMLEKLRNRSKQDVVDMESLESDIKDSDDKLAKEEEWLKCEFVKKLDHRHSVTQEDLEKLLDQYKVSQVNLNQQRMHERGLLNQRLQEKLSERKKSPPLESVEKTESTIATDDDKQSQPSEHEKIKALDEAFYKSLIERKQAGEISEEQLVSLIDGHLDMVDKLKRDIRKQLNERRRERHRQNAAEQASALVEDDRQKREQVRRLRKEERDKMDNKLQEKLKRRKLKKQMAQDSEFHPNDPPRKPERKSKYHHNSQDSHLKT